MKSLIIFAHPGTKGHCCSILDEVLNFHDSNNIKYDLIDLYKIKYDPVLKPEEHYTAGNRKITKQNKEFQNKISHTQNFIFIFPVWWGSMPAILKGFIDRVFTGRFAFTFNKHGFPIKLLKGNSIVFMTSGGPNFFYWFYNPARAIIKKVILQFCGIKTKVYQVGNAKKFTDKNIGIIKKTVQKALSRFY